MRSYRQAMRNYAVFRGRASRAEFWLFELTYLLILFAAAVLEALLDLHDPGNSVLVHIVYLVHFLPQLAVTIRRMHDSDHSGWWLLLPPVALIFLFFGSTTGVNQFGSPSLRAGRRRSITPPPSATARIEPALSAQPRPDLIAELERLASLKTNGSLSEAEYEVMKAQTMAQVGRA